MKMVNMRYIAMVRGMFRTNVLSLQDEVEASGWKA